MAIRINLLAEAQALEELRRRDPVKRLVLAGILMGLGMLVWSSILYLKANGIKSELNRYEVELRSKTNDYQAVLDTQKKLNDVEYKLVSLRSLATNRFLYGTMLDALQKTTIDDVHLLSLRTEHAYFPTEAVKAKTNATGRITSAARPATVTEKTLLTLSARDTSANPGDLVVKYRQALAESEYFRAALSSSNDVVLRQYVHDSGSEGKPGMNFTLECRYPERMRSQ